MKGGSPRITKTHVVLGALLLLGLALLALVGASRKAKQEIDERKPVCEAGCRTMIAAGMPSRLDECTAECQSDPKLASCMGLAGPDTDKLGLCYIKRSCGSMVPAGKTSCKDTKDCQDRCPANEMACSCACFRGMDPSKAGEAVIETTCEWNLCGKSCLGEGADRSACQKCAAERCQRERALCRAN